MKNTLLFALSILALHIHAQQPIHHCGADEISYELYRNNPQLQATMQANRDALRASTQKYVAGQGHRASDSLYIIPVVFHIIHTYGSENISDEQIMSGLKVMNRNFRNQNPDTATIAPAFKAIAADCEIEFRLAHKDPNGNCTNGINRIASTLTNIGDHSVKDLIHWDPRQYLNIYVVKQIPNLAGHCLMPDQAAAKPEWDGIVISHQYVGDTGTANDLRSVVLAHEAGHYLNLFHIWGGNNVPGYFYQPVGQQANCGIGDDVSDTPPTIGWSSCNLTFASCGNVVDNVQNAMDYSYCNFMFTQGQRLRMRAALNDTMAGRNNLPDPVNLFMTGVDVTDVCYAGFTADHKVVCLGDTVRFTDKSLANPASWQWDFGDGNSSTQQNPHYVYTAPGNYRVTLASSSAGGAAVSDTMDITVNTIADAYRYYIQDFEGINWCNEAYLHTDADNDSLKYAVVNTGYNSTKSAAIRMADTTADFSGRTTLTSPVINLEGTSLAGFSFKYAFSQKVLNNNDKLDVLVSNDCGKTWASRGSRAGTNLRTTSIAQTNNSWAPVDSTQWKTYSFLVPNAYAVNNFMFKIELTSYRGNTFYIDDIFVNPDAGYTGIGAIQLQGVELSPNPSNSSIRIEGLPDTMPYTLTDITGKQCAHGAIDNGQLLDISTLPAGIYNLSLQNELMFCNKRVVKY